MSQIIVDDALAVQWDRQADVVVVGFGGAGAVAALQAREGKASVILIDRFGGGGTTSYSGGVIYAGPTRFQREAGFVDTVDEMHAYLKMEVGDAVRPETLRRFCEGSAGDVEWLVGHGVRYASDAYLDKITYPPEGKFLYYSGNEKSPAFAEKAKPAPRGHRAVGPGFGGAHYMTALRQSVHRNDISLMLHSRANRLICSRDGAVLGVEVIELAEEKHAEQQALYEKVSPYVPHNHASTERALRRMRVLEERYSRTTLVRARGGVVLTTGGFAYSRTLIDRYDQAFARHYDVLHRLSTMGNDGSGLMMGKSVGAAVGRMDSLYIARNISPPEALLEGVLVNREGGRFVAEDAYVSLIGGEVARQTDGDAWLLVNARCFRRSIQDAITCGWQRFKYFGVPMLVNYALGGTRRGSTVATLARKIGVEPARLEATIRRHDEDIAVGRPDAVGKMDELRKPIGKGPIYAINMSMSNRHALTKFMTLGGLKVDEDSGAVVRDDGTPIPGLYAAGMAAVGLHSNGYISGLSIADGVFSGRRAGRNAARAVERSNWMPDSLRRADAKRR
ncbi:FAD-binding protein [Bradyrhizobium liaoningense]